MGRERLFPVAKPIDHERSFAELAHDFAQPAAWNCDRSPAHAFEWKQLALRAAHRDDGVIECERLIVDEALLDLRDTRQTQVNDLGVGGF